MIADDPVQLGLGPAAGEQTDVVSFYPGEDSGDGPRLYRRSRLLLAYWDRLRGERSFPSRNEIDPAEIEGVWPHCLVIRVPADGSNLSFDHVGAALQDGYEIMQSSAISGMSQCESVFCKVVALAREVVASREPRQVDGVFRTGMGGEVRFRCAAVPLSDDQRRINYVLGLASHLEIDEPVAAVGGLR